MDYIVLLLSVAAGAFTVTKLRLTDPAFVKLFNAFTGAYLLCLVFLHIVPELYAVEHVHEPHGEHDDPRPWIIGVFVLAGFFAQVLLENLTMGVEHAHQHTGHHQAVRVGMVIGLCVHALMEATAVGSRHHGHDHGGDVLLWSIAIHKYPVTVAFLGTLLQSGMSRAKAFLLLAVFAAMAPIGVLLGEYTPLAEYNRELTAIVVGIFMHVSTTVLFETTDSHRFNMGKMVAILIGLIAGGLTLAIH